MTNNPAPWWHTFYDDHLAAMLLDNTSEAEIQRTADFLENILEVCSHSRILDQCCGTGRLSWALAKRGHALLGVDLIPRYIERAKAGGVATPVPEFIAADALTYVAAAPCDAAFNWWTSFGYVAEDTENLRMLQRVCESLKPGGVFALDTMNVPGLYRHFRPQVVTRHDGVTLVRESSLDLAAGVIRKQWTYFLPDGKRVEHETAVRLYDPAMLRKLFTQAGFSDVRFLGDVDASPLTLDSPRCLVIARKPR